MSLTAGLADPLPCLVRHRTIHAVLVAVTDRPVQDPGPCLICHHVIRPDRAPPCQALLRHDVSPGE
ncbi:MAG: hypothetical protein OXD35_13645 [Thiotrichales bacterium]|nr:hypothetical protein [Thiotrichales bacterium]